jgi:hypothetical protein
MEGKQRSTTATASAPQKQARSSLSSAYRASPSFHTIRLANLSTWIIIMALRLDRRHDVSDLCDDEDLLYEPDRTPNLKAEFVNRDAMLAQRRALFDEGLSDAEIGRQQGVSKDAIWAWRRLRNLPSRKVRAPHVPLNRANTRYPPLTPEQEAKRVEMYQAGFADSTIARVIGTVVGTIEYWRRKNGFPPNFPQGRSESANPSLALPTPDLKRRALALMHRGLGVTLIAAELRASKVTLAKWKTVLLRERPDLSLLGKGHSRPKRKANGQSYRPLPSALRPRAFVLYADGRNDHEIARDLGVAPSRVWEWRAALSLPALIGPGRPRPPHSKAARKSTHKPWPAAITPMTNPLYARIAEAIGRGIAADVRDDAISEMWLAIEEGTVAVASLVSAAKRFRNRAVSDYANPYGPRSVDEDIGDGDGFRMIDLIRDDRSSSWLEEAGATVW